MKILNLSERKQRQTIRDAESIFQVQENGGELWFIFNGNLVCPCSMFKDEPVEVLRKMRELYIKRNQGV